MAANVMNRVVLVAITVFLTSAGEGSAQQMNAKEAKCDTRGMGTTEMAFCYLNEAQDADQELNLLYNKIQKVLSPTDKNKLQAAQRLWVQFRDANCEAERELYHGGSMAPMVYQACLGADTRQRTTGLRGIYGWLLEK